MTTPQPNPTDDLEAETTAEMCVIGDLMTADLEFGAPLSPYRYRALARAVIKAIVDPNAPPAILALRPAGVGEAVAYMLEWSVDGESRRRVQTHLRIEPWLEQYAPTITTLYAHPATPAHPDAALMERVRTVLESARDDLRSFATSRGSEYEGSADDASAEIDALLSDLKAEAGR